jgi:hypothetical protein
MDEGGFGEMRIGAVLAATRERAGLDLRAVEEETKIRGKYLRAIEAEDWATLPSDAYAKGFIRTYGELLGLDAEALVDEYRRQVESRDATPARPIGDRVLEGRRRVGEPPRRPSRVLIGAGVAVGIAAILAVIGLSADDDASKPKGGAVAGRHKPERHGSRRHGSSGQDGTVKLALNVHDPVEVCLLGGGGEALIDGQVLAAGTEEQYERHSFSLRFPSGFAPDEFRLEVAGEKRILPKVDGPAAFTITPPRHVRAARTPGKVCP